MKETIFTTTDGQKLACVIWDTVKNPVGVVQIIHSIDEHIRRYDNFAKYLNKNGYIVFGNDHRVNGKTGGIGQDDIFMSIVNDEIQILEYLKSKYKLSVFLFGHSYGSFITQRVMECSDLCAAGVCISDSAQFPLWFLRLGAMIAWVGAKLRGPNAPAKLLEHFSPIRDTIHTEYFSYGFYYSLFHNLIQISYNVNCNMPILIISGGADLVSRNASLVGGLYKAYQAHNIENLTVIIYPDVRHELLTELNYPDIQRDILDFFNSVSR